jgi:hypothetical protein
MAEGSNYATHLKCEGTDQPGDAGRLLPRHWIPILRSSLLQCRVVWFYDINCFFSDRLSGLIPELGGRHACVLFVHSLRDVAFRRGVRLALRRAGSAEMPRGLCVHDLSLASDYCARGLIIADTPSGPTITVASPKASALLRRLQTKPTVGNE